MKAMTTVATPARLPLTDADVASFERNGFLAIERLADGETVARLGELYDAILRKEIDLGENDRLLGDLTRQVMNPSAHHSFFADNPALRAGKEIGRRLLPGDPAP